MTPAGVLALSLAERQALVPMAAGYLILMSALAFGLRRLYRPRRAPSRAGGRDGAGGGDGAGGAGTRPDQARATPPGPPRRNGRAALLKRVGSTVAGGYLLLLAVVVAYYFGVARVGPGFLKDEVTGTALLLGLAAPVFAVASWLAERGRRS
jgi:Family of unknown function (DUF6256)